MQLYRSIKRERPQSIHIFGSFTINFFMPTGQPQKPEKNGFLKRII